MPIFVYPECSGMKLSDIKKARIGIPVRRPTVVKLEWIASRKIVEAPVQDALPKAE